MSILSDIIDDDPKLEMTPMIDVTFLLLIFFMCTIKFKILEGKLSAYLPKDVGVNTTQAEPVEKVEVVLRVKTEGDKYNEMRSPRRNEKWDGSGRYRYTGRVIEYQIGPQKTTKVSELTRFLRDRYQADPDRPSTIDARQGIVYGDVVPALDAAVSVGYTDITFIGEYKPSPKKK